MGIEGVVNERRGKQRFILQQELRFQLIEDDRIIRTGSGSTLDMSSAGVAFSTDSPLRLKHGVTKVQLSIAWPVLLDKQCRMQLIVFGRLIRIGDRNAATIDRYEFRTQARTVRSSIETHPSFRRWTANPTKELKAAPAQA